MCIAREVYGVASDVLFNVPEIHNSQIGWKSIEMMHNLTNSTTQFIEMMPGQISRIGWKSTEITLFDCQVESVVELGGNPLRLHCRPAWSNRSNWVEIH